MQPKGITMKTITFNTHRKYTAEGQVIVATLHDDGVVTFMDHSRGVSGEFMLDSVSFCESAVMAGYDGNRYQGSSRAWADGMRRDGCNARKA